MKGKLKNNNKNTTALYCLKKMETKRHKWNLTEMSLIKKILNKEKTFEAYNGLYISIYICI